MIEYIEYFAVGYGICSATTMSIIIFASWANSIIKRNSLDIRKNFLDAMIISIAWPYYLIGTVFIINRNIKMGRDAFDERFLEEAQEEKNKE